MQVILAGADAYPACRDCGVSRTKLTLLDWNNAREEIRGWCIYLVHYHDPDSDAYCDVGYALI